MRNKGSNALPRCQLNMLWSRGQHLLKDHSQVALSSDNEVNPFVLGVAHVWHAAPNIIGLDRNVTTVWMDTLCIPLEEETKKIAIRGMKGAYEKGFSAQVYRSRQVR